MDFLLVVCSVRWSLWSFLTAGWAQHLHSALPELREEMGDLPTTNALCTGRAKKPVSNCTSKEVAKS